MVSKRVVSADVPPEREPERGYVRQNHPFTKPPFYLPVKEGLLSGNSNTGPLKLNEITDPTNLSGPKYASQKRNGLKTQFSIRHFRAGIRRSTRFETPIRPAIR